jgi:hypothetical protein
MPLAKRRFRLEAFAKRYLQDVPHIKLSPVSDDLKVAKGWLQATGGNLDGIIANPIDLDYRSGPPRRHAEDQTTAHGRLRRRRVSLHGEKESRRFAAVRSLRR